MEPVEYVRRINEIIRNRRRVSSARETVSRVPIIYYFDPKLGPDPEGVNW